MTHQHYGTHVFRGAHAMGRTVTRPLGGTSLAAAADESGGNGDSLGANTVLHLAGAAVAGGVLGYVSAGYKGTGATIGALLMVGVVGLGDAWSNMKEGRSNAALAAAVVGIGGTAFSLYLAKSKGGGGFWAD